MQIDFDPSIISYEEMVDLFWKDHNPLLSSWSKQYQAALYTHTDDQLRVAQADSLKFIQPGSVVHTVIEPLRDFYIAEDYHQKHYLQLIPALMREFEEYFNYFSDFNDSPTVAKVNGFAAGKGSRNFLQSLLLELNLSEKAMKILYDRSAK